MNLASQAFLDPLVKCDDSDDVPYPFLDNNLWRSTGNLSESFEMARLETGVHEIFSPKATCRSAYTTLIFRTSKSKTPLVTPEPTPDNSLVIMEQRMIHESIKAAHPSSERVSSKEASRGKRKNFLNTDNPSEELSGSFVFVERDIDSEPERPETLCRQIVAIAKLGRQRLEEIGCVDRVLDGQQLFLILSNLARQLHSLQDNEGEWLLVNSPVETPRASALEDNEVLLTSVCV